MPQTIYDLVFEGGGAKGSVFVGAMEAFNEKGYKTRRLVGTSAGAITATLLAAGFAPEEMLEAVNEQHEGKPRFDSFMDEPERADFNKEVVTNSDLMKMLRKIDLHIPSETLEQRVDEALIGGLMRSDLFCQLLSFTECGGLFVGDEFLKWIEEKITKKGFNAGITLKEFNEHEKVKNELSLVATDTDDHRMLVLNHRTAPNCPVIMAVRMSMSIPFVWQEVVWHEEWGRYLGKRITGHRIVDGGVLSNFPISLVNNTPQKGSHEEQVMGNDMAANDAGTIGFLIDESLEVQGQPKKTDSSVSKLKVTQRVIRLIDTMTGAHDNSEIVIHKDIVCRLPAQGYGTTEFAMEKTRLDALVRAGNESTKEFLNK